MQTLRTLLPSALWRMLFGPIGRLVPFGACRRIAVPLGSALWMIGIRRDVVLRNLALAFPHLSQAERRQIGRRSHINLITVFLEMLTLRHLSERRLAHVLRIENIELLRSMGPEGAILLSGHFGNWELLAFGAAAIAGVPFAIIVKEQNDYGQLTRMRTARGNSVIPTDRAAREAAAMLRSGGAVAMLADQAAAEHEPLVEMFGIPTHTYSAPARLALRFRPRVIAAVAVRQPDGCYRAVLRTIEHTDLPDSPDGVLELTTRYVAQLEAEITCHREQWAWQHRKWKNTPGVTY